MFKSVFVKYMLCFLLTFAVSFSFLYLMFVGMVSSNEKTNSITHAAESAKVMIDRDYVEYQSNESRDYFTFIKDEGYSLEMQIPYIFQGKNRVAFHLLHRLHLR